MASGSAAAGARPLALRPVSSPSRHTSAKQSPPTPVDIGSTTHSTAAAASAASTALPPRSSARRPACVASGWLVATMPRAATALERAGNGRALDQIHVTSSRPSKPSGSGVPTDELSATLTTPRPSSAHLSRIGRELDAEQVDDVLAPERGDLGRRLALDLLAQHRHRGLRDRAALAAEAHGLDALIVGQAQVDGDLVAAERVLALGRRIVRIELAAVARALVVVEDLLAVEVLVHHANSRARPRARRRDGRSPRAPCTGRSSRASSPERRSGASAAACSDARRARRRRGGRGSAPRRADARRRT